MAPRALPRKVMAMIRTDRLRPLRMKTGTVLPTTPTVRLTPRLATSLPPIRATTAHPTPSLLNIARAVISSRTL